MGARRFPWLLAALVCAAGVACAQAPAGASNAAGSHDEGVRIRRTPTVVAVEKAHASVVNISTERVIVTHRGFDSFFGRGGDPFDRLFEEFFGRRHGRPGLERRKVETPLGSGCVITSDGLVITNEHVVRRATNIKLSLDNGETCEGILLAADPSEDIALLRMDTDKPMQAIPMGTSSDLMLGETVVAMGNPFGFENSVTSGIISAFNREITVGNGREGAKYEGLIQTSALINPGNSGGPLVNVLGELVGINTAVVDQAQGIGFAIPIDRAREVLAPLLSTPQVSEAWGGVRAVTADGRGGARIIQVEPAGPAKSSLKVGDIVREIDGVPVNDLFGFLLGIVQHKPNDKVSLRIMRDDKVIDVTLALGRMPVPSPKRMLYDKLGIAGEDHTAERARELGIAVDYGVLVSKLWSDGPAAKVGLEKDDVIVQIGSHPVRNLRDAAATLKSVRPGEDVFIRIVRKNLSAYTWISVAK